MFGGAFVPGLAAMAPAGIACPTARAARPKKALWPVRFRNERRSTARARLSLTIRVVFSSMSVPLRMLPAVLEVGILVPRYERRRKSTLSWGRPAPDSRLRAVSAPYAGYTGCMGERPQD